LVARAAWFRHRFLGASSGHDVGKLPSALSCGSDPPRLKSTGRERCHQSALARGQQLDAIGWASDRTQLFPVIWTINRIIASVGAPIRRAMMSRLTENHPQKVKSEMNRVLDDAAMIEGQFGVPP
jgi:hypothetical protein